MPEIKGILVDKISSIYKVKKMIKKSLNSDDVDFVNIELEEKPPFLPQVKVDLGLKEIVNSIKLQ